MEPIEIRFRLTESEFMSACNAHWSTCRQGTSTHLIIGTACIFIGLALLGYMFWIALVATTAGALFFLILGLRSVLWRRAFREAKKYHGEISVTFSENGVHVESVEGKSDLKWSFYSWHLETSNFMILHMTKRAFSVIPKAAFQESKQWQQFVDLVRSKLEKIQ